MNSHFEQFRKKITHPLKYRSFLLTKLPMGFISGLTIENLTPQMASVSVKYGWLNQNPFQSIYFAVLSMAAELSTGVLALGQVYGRNPKVSMLVTHCEGNFVKKAVGKILFTCNNGDAIIEAVEKAVATGEGVTITCQSCGINQQGETVAVFNFTWSFKCKKN